MFYKNMNPSAANKFKIAVLFLILLGVLQTHLFAEVQLYKLDASQSKLLFEVGTTFHTVHGQANSFTSKVSFDPVSGEVQLPVQVEVAVNSMDTNNKKRDKAMNVMLQSGQYPTIRWTAAKVNCRPGGSAGTMVCDADGGLEIRNIKQEKKFQISLTLHDGRIQAKGSWSLERKDFGLKTPSLLGLMRVDQEVKIAFETVWTPEKT